MLPPGRDNITCPRGQRHEITAQDARKHLTSHRSGSFTSYCPGQQKLLTTSGPWTTHRSGSGTLDHSQVRVRDLGPLTGQGCRYSTTSNDGNWVNSAHQGRVFGVVSLVSAATSAAAEQFHSTDSTASHRSTKQYRRSFKQ